jgi:hypothetical protein
MIFQHPVAYHCSLRVHTSSWKSIILVANSLWLLSVSADKLRDEQAMESDTLQQKKSVVHCVTLKIRSVEIQTGPKLTLPETFSEINGSVHI